MIFIHITVFGSVGAHSLRLQYVVLFKTVSESLVAVSKSVKIHCASEKQG